MASDQLAARLERIACANEGRRGLEAFCGPEEEVILATRADAPDEAASDEGPTKSGLLDLVELILKRRDRLERLVRDRAVQAELLPRFLAISLVGFLFFGVAVSLVFTSAGVWPRVVPIRDLIAGQGTNVAPFEPFAAGETALGRWLDGSALRLIAAYSIGLIAATGICLPSLYFYGLLAGVRMTMLDVVLQSLKAKATAAVALVGILPIYAALGLGVVVFDAPQPVRLVTFWLGLILPYLAGLFGTHSLYQGLAGFADTFPVERQGRRACFLRRLVLSWAACYTAVTPVMIHTLWVWLASTSAG
jgi:hypothetical protein